MSAAEHNWRERVIKEARTQIEQDRFAAAVEKEKQRLMASRWWHRYVPIITITWRK